MDSEVGIPMVGQDGVELKVEVEANPIGNRDPDGLRLGVFPNIPTTSLKINWISIAFKTSSRGYDYSIDQYD